MRPVERPPVFVSVGDEPDGSCIGKALCSATYASNAFITSSRVSWSLRSRRRSLMSSISLGVTRMSARKLNSELTLPKRATRSPSAIGVAVSMPTMVSCSIVGGSVAYSTVPLPLGAGNVMDAGASLMSVVTFILLLFPMLISVSFRFRLTLPDASDSVAKHHVVRCPLEPVVRRLARHRFERDEPVEPRVRGGTHEQHAARSRRTDRPSRPLHHEPRVVRVVVDRESHVAATHRRLRHAVHRLDVTR